jgi:hypothetical protein
MTEDILAIGGFFTTVIVLAIGVPLVRSYIRRKEAEPAPHLAISDARLQRIEQAVEAMAIEIERISEGQRFVTRLLAEREAQAKSLPSSESR